MKRLVILFFFVLCLLVETACNPPHTSNKPAEQPQQPTNQARPNATVSPASAHNYDFTSLDDLLARIARKHGGCALVLVKDEKVIYRKGFGSHGPDRVIPIASASKWLAGALIMGLVDEGKLSLDDHASKYLPEFTGAKSTITIRQLFAHTSGLPPEAEFAGRIGL